MKKIRNSLVWALVLALGSVARAAPSADDFFRPAPDRGVALKADEIYPQGRIFPFAGYSGKPERERAAGFSMVGPCYGGVPAQLKMLDAAERVGMKFAYTIGLPMKFASKDPSKILHLGASEIEQKITEQVKKVVNRSGVCWWYIHPEEQRYWRKDEMDYLRVVTGTIRKLDPRKRPIWMYEPNHRTAAALAKTGRFLDIIGKGFYVNSKGFKDNRLWVRWSIEQEAVANRELGGRHALLIMPELCRDVPPDERPMIAAWVRHDVYLGLMHGGQGVVIWSLFRRGRVRETYDLWYRAYSESARQLCGPTALGQVFLFGEERRDLKVEQTAGDRTVAFGSPKEIVESDSLSERKKQSRRFEYPPLSTRELHYGNARYLFVCNSSAQPMRVSVTGFPAEECQVKELLQGREFAASADGRTLTAELGSWDVRCLRFEQRTPHAPREAVAAKPRVLVTISKDTTYRRAASRRASAKT